MRAIPVPVRRNSKDNNSYYEPNYDAEDRFVDAQQCSSSFTSASNGNGGSKQQLNINMMGLPKAPARNSKMMNISPPATPHYYDHSTRINNSRSRSNSKENMNTMMMPNSPDENDNSLYASPMTSYSPNPDSANRSSSKVSTVSILVGSKAIKYLGIYTTVI
jgi:hypothetical protein